MVRYTEGGKRVLSGEIIGLFQFKTDQYNGDGRWQFITAERIVCFFFYKIIPIYRYTLKSCR